MNTNFIKINMFYGADSTTFRTAAMLRKNMTLPERILWEKLKDRKIFRAKFRKQHPIWIFIVDFYCHEFKLVIEVDGEIHYHEDLKEYDLNITAELERFGIKVIRFTNDQIIYELDWVLIEIQKVISKFTPL
jgi:very-short-patch-repair endonuclease